MLFMGQIGIHLQICCPLSNSGQAWNFKSVLTFTIELCVSCQLSNVLRAESRFTSRGMRSFFVTLFFGFFLLRTSLFSLGSSNSFNVVSLTLQNNHICTLILWNLQIWQLLDPVCCKKRQKKFRALAAKKFMPALAVIFLALWVFGGWVNWS